MPQFDEEWSKRAEDWRKSAAEMSKDLRKLAADFSNQMQIFAEDVVKRAKGSETAFEGSPIEKIRALAQLRDEGIITEEEFQQQKQRLLEQI